MFRTWILPVVVMATALAVMLGFAGSPPGHSDEGRVPAGNGTWPLDPRPAVVAGFDPPAAPWAAGHRGVDLAGRVAQPVRAALPGEVGFAGSVAGKPVVVIDHGSTRTTYEPVVAAVQVGDAIPAGAVVGHLVVPGSHCPPAACLHFGWIRNADDVYLDPLELLGMLPVRLWPWAGSADAPGGRGGQAGVGMPEFVRAAVAGGVIGRS